MMGWDIHGVYFMVKLVHLDELFFDFLILDWYIFGALLEALDSSVGGTRLVHV